MSDTSSTSTSSESNSQCEMWRNEVKDFIIKHYHVNNVTSREIGFLFNGHYFGTSYGISYDSIRHCFARKKGLRPPTRNMKVSFRQIKLLEESNRLINFPDMTLRSEKHPFYTAEILTAIYFWSMSCSVTITEDTTHTEMQRLIDSFLEYCKGKFCIDKTLFSGKNIVVFKWQYLDHVIQRKPVPEN